MIHNNACELIWRSKRRSTICRTLPRDQLQPPQWLDDFGVKASVLTTNARAPGEGPSNYSRERPAMLPRRWRVVGAAHKDFVCSLIDDRIQGQAAALYNHQGPKVTPTGAVFRVPLPPDLTRLLQRMDFVRE
jgi:hypothetical protein